MDLRLVVNAEGLDCAGWQAVAGYDGVIRRGMGAVDHNSDCGTCHLRDGGCRAAGRLDLRGTRTGWRYPFGTRDPGVDRLALRRRAVGVAPLTEARWRNARAA
jgi:hypothetical protein